LTDMLQGCKSIVQIWLQSGPSLVCSQLFPHRLNWQN
jgi:hypothetical protein